MYELIISVVKSLDSCDTFFPECLALNVALDNVTQVPLDQNFTVIASGNGQGIMEV